jgi:hypothetical protein
VAAAESATRAAAASAAAQAPAQAQAAEEQAAEEQAAVEVAPVAQAAPVLAEAEVSSHQATEPGRHVSMLTIACIMHTFSFVAVSPRVLRQQRGTLARVRCATYHSLFVKRTLGSDVPTSKRVTWLDVGSLASRVVF